MDLCKVLWVKHVQGGGGLARGNHNRTGQYHVTKLGVWLL